jgi:hypothetical protein
VRGIVDEVFGWEVGVSLLLLLWLWLLSLGVWWFVHDIVAYELANGWAIAS